jgi:HD superfamily phosphohydrolase
MSPRKKSGARAPVLPLVSREESIEGKKRELSALLARPLVALPLPSDFRAIDETDSLAQLWDAVPELNRYELKAFVHAGGAGMVFKAVPAGGGQAVAIKVARKALLDRAAKETNLPTSLSPVSVQELRALEALSHRGIVGLRDVFARDGRVVAIATTYVDDPAPLDQYLRATLEKKKRGIRSFSPERLDKACAFLAGKITEVAEALDHMHSRGFYHFDLKPANILIDSKQFAVITDLGACLEVPRMATGTTARVQFTWTYAHPELTDLVSQPKSISGGGLKASAELKIDSELARFDLFALGRTLQECLAILVTEFGERCFASYNFRFLHLVASLLLDGRISPTQERHYSRDGRRFVQDSPIFHPGEILSLRRIRSAAALGEKLRRFRDGGWIYREVPELDPWTPETINTGIPDPSPFSKRVAEVMTHPVMRRLRNEYQLGWIREVYPGANGSRWAHTLGVFGAVADYYAALIADPEMPFARLLLEAADVEHALVAAILHDAGQVSFGHDLEAASPAWYRHEELVGRLVQEPRLGAETLSDLIERLWPRVKLQRVLKILGFTGGEGDQKGGLDDPIDGLARDVISGPIDADKLDYLVRDAASCGVPYGGGIDRRRFLRALTVDVREVAGYPRLALAYRAKSTTSIEALLLARYQMYGAVYWHHSFRCIQAMFAHAVAAAIPEKRTDKLVLRQTNFDWDALEEFFYLRVVCGLTLERCKTILGTGKLQAWIFREETASIAADRTLEFVWKISSDPMREFLDRLATRSLFKRVFELRVGELGAQGDYSALATALSPSRRLEKARALQKAFLVSTYRKMQEKGPTHSVSESDARKTHQELQAARIPLLVLDFPTRGIPEERNFPLAIGDPARKYIAGRGGDPAGIQTVFHAVKRLQLEIAALRIFVEPDLHGLIVRYLEPHDVRACADEAIGEIRGA